MSNKNDTGEGEKGSEEMSTKYPSTTQSNSTVTPGQVIIQLGELGLTTPVGQHGGATHPVTTTRQTVTVHCTVGDTNQVIRSLLGHVTSASTHGHAQGGQTHNHPQTVEPFSGVASQNSSPQLEGERGRSTPTSGHDSDARSSSTRGHTSDSEEGSPTGSVGKRQRRHQAVSITEGGQTGTGNATPRAAQLPSSLGSLMHGPSPLPSYQSHRPVPSSFASQYTHLARGGGFPGHQVARTGGRYGVGLLPTPRGMSQYVGGEGHMGEKYAAGFSSPRPEQGARGMPHPLITEPAPRYGRMQARGRGVTAPAPTVRGSEMVTPMETFGSRATSTGWTQARGEGITTASHGLPAATARESLTLSQESRAPSTGWTQARGEGITTASHELPAATVREPLTLSQEQVVFLDVRLHEVAHSNLAVTVRDLASCLQLELRLVRTFSELNRTIEFLVEQSRLSLNEIDLVRKNDMAQLRHTLDADKDYGAYPEYSWPAGFGILGDEAEDNSI